MKEKNLIENNKKYESETQSLLSNPRKPERERKVVRAQLRCLGIDFSHSEIQSKEDQDDPVDVIFREAQYQVMDIHGGHKPGLESRKRMEKYEAAKKDCDLLTPYKSPEPKSLDEMVQEVTNSLEKKAKHYGGNTCSDLDVLVYVNLQERYLWPLESFPNNLEALRSQGWRSVSVLFVPYSTVLIANDSAPCFIRDRVGRVLSEWNNSDGWFDP